MLAVNSYMRVIVLFIFTVFFSSAYSQKASGPRVTDHEVNGGAYLGYKYVHVIPSNLNQCLLSLSCSSPQRLNQFTDYSLENALKKGLNNKYNRLRMNWKLELESSPLTQYFYHQKIYHHETMETIILWALYNDLNGKEMKLKQIIRKSKKRHKSLEKKEKRRLKNAYKSYRKAIKKQSGFKKDDRRVLPPTSFEEWIFTY